LALAARRLAAAGCETPRLEAEVLLAHVLGRDRSWLYLYLQERLEPGRLAKFEELLTRRGRREPVAYLTGHKEFFGLDFEVTPAVLIPRPETELLVETALELAGPTRPCLVVDVGTGSGCIAVTLAKHLPAGQFWATDISSQALQVARRNADRHGVTGRMTLVQTDLLQPVAGPFDLLVSNPPYISPAELQPETMQPEVYRYEPRLALDGGEAGLAIIQQLLSQARAKLKPGGSVLVEIGATQGQAVTQLAGRFFPQAGVQVKKDLAGLDRLLVIRA
jgi:release factor glutamine methyltransferase